MPGSMTTTIYDYVFESSKNTKQSRLKFLIDKGLIEQRKTPDNIKNKFNTKRYDLTEKGEEVLVLLTQLHNLMNDDIST